MDKQLAPYQQAWEYRKTLIEMPRELTAENGAKEALSGEFFEEIELEVECDGEDCDEHDCDGDFHTFMQQVPVSWTTIKSIWKRAVEHFERAAASVADGKEGNDVKSS